MRHGGLISAVMTAGGIAGISFPSRRRAPKAFPNSLSQLSRFHLIARGRTRLEDF
jgi:hypothetical protein